MVHKVWQEAGLKPHRLERYMASNDPDFERKAADIIGLYLDPPQHAAVFSVDEKTAIQALDRRDRVLPLPPGRAERRGFEYKRNGTLSLYAALNTKTGAVQGKTAAHHTSHEFVDFLGEVVAGCEPGREIHIICDNLSAHKTKLVAAFLSPVVSPGVSGGGIREGERVLEDRGGAIRAGSRSTSRQVGLKTVSGAWFLASSCV